MTFEVYRIYESYRIAGSKDIPICRAASVEACVNKTLSYMGIGYFMPFEVFDARRGDVLKKVHEFPTTQQDSPTISE